MTLNLYIATRKGVWIGTADAQRRSWKLSDPRFLGQQCHHVVLDPRDRTTLLCASRQWHLGPTVFRSTDGGATWSEVSNVPPSVFGFAVAVHPKRPETAWFVPAVKDECRVPVNGEFVVTRTRDGGQTFDVLRTGLPAAPAYDIVYRHGLAVDATGSRLAVGSTTGGFWTSDDEGDSWVALPARLPPVHAVSFVA